MNLDHRGRLSRIMQMAWCFFREAKRADEVRSFGDCLRGAWGLSKRLAEAAVQYAGRRHVRLSPSLIRSPIRRACGSNRLKDFQAAYVTARFG